MYKKINIFLFYFLLAGFLSCSGGGGSSSSNNSSSEGVKWGYLLPETKGIYYKCDDLTGKTGPEGRFEYYKGKNVKFYLGGIELGTVAGQKIVTPFNLAGYATVPVEIQDGATSAELDNYPKARNITHFLLAVNELYNKYDNLVESLEAMNTELSSKTLSFDVSDNVTQFQARIEDIQNQTAWWSIFVKSCYAISIGGLNSINATLITTHLNGLNTNVNNYNSNKPGAPDDYDTIDYTGVENPPVDGSVMTMDQLKGIWLIVRGIYGDENGTPDGAYRKKLIDYPQGNYLARFNGSENVEDFLCASYSKWLEFSEDSFWMIVNITGPVYFRTGFTGILNGSDPWYDDTDTTPDSKAPADFEGLWRQSAKQSEDGIETYNGQPFNSDLYISTERTSDYFIIKLPEMVKIGPDTSTWDGVSYYSILFSKPEKGYVKMYYQEGTTKTLYAVLKKVKSSEFDGAKESFFPIDQ